MKINDYKLEFDYNIGRKHGKYGMAVRILDSCQQVVKIIKTYKYNNEEGCDINMQEKELIAAAGRWIEKLNS